MQLLICVLNKTQCLDEILSELSHRGIHGATILNSKGMAHMLSESGEIPIFDSILNFLNPDNSDSKTFFTVIDEERIPIVSDVINSVTGGLDRPDTGVLFTVPIKYTEGFAK